MAIPGFVELDFHTVGAHEQERRSEEFFALLNRRRTVRDYSDREVPLKLSERAIAAAGTAPSGANMQPWRFVVVKTLRSSGRSRKPPRKKNARAITAA